MRTVVHFIPIVTTLLTIPFAFVLFRHWRKKPAALYLFWWGLGVLMYGVGTLTESLTTLFGWSEVVFKSWYISGALLGGAPLAQGTIYLLMKKRTGHILTGVLLVWIVLASVFVVMSPLNYNLVETHRLSGSVFEWQWVRLFSPFINLYALIFLVGGAAWSALQYWRIGPEHKRRAWGNIYIAIGALLPGIGGTFTRAGYVEVLYVTEILGLSLIWVGYWMITHHRGRSIHVNQQTVVVASVEAAPEVVEVV